MNERAQFSDTAVVFPGPDEIDGFWSQDRIHAPRPMSPLAFELITDTMAIGFTRAHAEWGAPIDMVTRPVNHYLYSAFRPVTDPAERARRATVYEQLDDRLDEVGPLWEERWKPPLIESVRAGRVADYRPLDNEALVAELHRQREHMTDQWTIHGKVNFGVIAAARFTDFYDEVFQPADRTESMALLQGFETETVRASQAMWALSRQVASSDELQALLARTDDEVLAAVRAADADPAVASFGAALQAFLDEFGWRSDAVYDVADRPWREDPAIPLDSLRRYAGLGPEHDPDLAFARAAARRESLLAAARGRLASDPERARLFERYYEAARHNLRLTEDHAFWIDQSGVVNFRRFLLQVGERLVAGGCLDAAEDVFFLQQAEVVEALRHGGDRRAVAAQRRASVARAAQVEAPRSLGTPPPPSKGKLDPLIDALTVRLSGRRPPQTQDDTATVLTGLGASPGVVSGTARVVRSLAEAAKLDEGDILVCEMTLPPWVPLFAVAAAVVADTGGLMSHCAIVAREFGLPAVVGTQFGTRTIRDGMSITVDGDKGEVRIDRG
ncbi:MAG: PEP-utilizing enzyme [Acidimicrobiia bacterium]